MESHLHTPCWDFTRHMRQRMQQRGRTQADIFLIFGYGTEVRPDLYVLRKQDVDALIRQDKHLARRCDRLCGWAVVVCEGHAVTCYRLAGAAGRRAIRVHRLRPKRHSVLRRSRRVG